MRRLKKGPFPLWAIAFLLFSGCQPAQMRGAVDPHFVALQTETAQRASSLGPQSDQALGVQRVLMVAVRFPDVKPRFTLDHIKNRAVTRLNIYVKEQSYGLTWIQADFKGWVVLPDPISEYRVSYNNFAVDRDKVRKLVEDTMTAIEAQVDFSKYQHMLIIPGAFTLPGKGYGMICYCANPGMLTGVRGDVGYVTLRSSGGKEFSRGVFVGAENAHLGMFAHDFFHALGGVQDGKRLAP